MLNCQAGCRGVRWALYDKGEHSLASRRIHFLNKTAARATLLGDDGLRLQLLEQLLGAMSLVVNKMILRETSA